MRDALGRLQRVVMTGPVGPVATALAATWAGARKGLAVDLVAVPTPDAVRDHLAGLGARVHVSTDALAAALAAGEDVDVVVLVVADGAGEESAWQTPDQAVDLVDRAVRRPLVLATTAVDHLRRQGHGAVVVVMPSGHDSGGRAQTIALDATAQLLHDLGEAAQADGVQVVVVHQDAEHGPERLAELVDEGLRTGASSVGSPSAIQRISGALRALPGPVLRRLPVRK